MFHTIRNPLTLRFIVTPKWLILLYFYDLKVFLVASSNLVVRPENLAPFVAVHEELGAEVWKQVADDMAAAFNKTLESIEMGKQIT